ncbi:MAG: Mfa1 family fimbria major subunit [Prevotella sp.]|nr:Mfa1 family fimbria major subunit [Prevotella sp.]
MKKILFAMLACAGLCACSSDDIDLASSTQKVFDSDVAYLKVNLSEVGGSTRATYTASSENESAVSNAYFYFYDEQGSFVTEGEIDFSSSTNTATWSDGSGNIEKQSSNVVILEGLTGQGYPKYVVTVLNKPDNFDHGNTLDELQTKTVSSILSGDNFIMSTSSYSGASTDYGFVTELSNDNFVLNETTVDQATPVDIYVERLAAKVTLKVGSAVADAIGEKGYKLVQTIAGETNTDEAGNDEVATDLYVKFLGWKLNATAGDSYMMKDISDLTGTWWNDASNHHSKWCASYYYNSTVSNGKISGLDYVDLKADGLKDCTSDGVTVYCAENTNKSVESKGSPAITGIVVKAQVSDSEGNAVTLVRYNGLLFTEDAFKSTLIYDNDLYSDENGSTALTKESLTISDGSISVASGTTVYQKGDDGTISQVSDTSTLFDNIEFTYYYQGLMYYNIPIEHANDQITNDAISEGYYGIVRNYHYVVTITSLENLGVGVEDEGDTIIPDDTTNPTYYYVPADIKILSWNEVEQNAAL